MPFSDIIGHSRQVEILRRGLERGRLPHAYLFLGPPGIGKRMVALSLAMAVHCSDGPHEFCGLCPSCLSIRDGNHPDVRFVEPLAGKREIGIQQIRELERELAFHPFSGKYKVAIIDPADLLNYHAQNSLLKTVEEPPGDSLLILIAKSTGHLLPTLTSRCLRLSFASPPREFVAEVLVRRKGISREQAGVLAALTMGSVGEALACDTGEYLDRRREWIERLSSLSREGYREMMALAEERAGDREESLRFLHWIEGWYRDILICQITGKTEGMRHADMVERIREQAVLYSIDQILFILSQIAQVTAEMQKNYNRRLALERFFIKVLSCGKQVS